MSIYSCTISTTFHRESTRTCPVPFGTAGRSRSVDVWDCPWPWYCHSFKLWKMTMFPWFMGKSTMNGPCSIAMLNHQRVTVYSCLIHMLITSNVRSKEDRTMTSVLGLRIELEGTKVVKAVQLFSIPQPTVWNAPIFAIDMAILGYSILVPTGIPQWRAKYQ